MQLSGPVPEPLYHRYVEFKPFVAGMFTSHSLRGRILNRTLHHQHARIYNYDRSTLYGIYYKPSIEMTKHFLDFVHYDHGGRIFTYIITLDGQWRFTETGKEFGIDMLSKHTMHSNVSIYIAFSGEFFIRRLKHAHKSDSESSQQPNEDILPPDPQPEDEEGNRQTNKSPAHYEMIIDNDSGTYRPNAKYLDTLKDFMARNLEGLKVVTLDCQKDEEKMKKLKDEQRERKKDKSKQVTYLQNSSQSSISSSDEEELAARAGDGTGSKKQQAKDKMAAMKAMKAGASKGTANGQAPVMNGLGAQQVESEKAGGDAGGDGPAMTEKSTANEAVAREQTGTETTTEKPLLDEKKDSGYTNAVGEGTPHHLQATA